MKAVNCKFSRELVVSSLQLPVGTEVVGAQFDPQNGVVILTLANEILPDIPEGEPIPIGYVVYKQTETFFARPQ